MRPVILFCAVVLFVTAIHGAGTTPCLTVYRNGGAPAVFSSPNCPRWKIHNLRSRTCETSMLRGRRKALEDRILCAMDIPIPFPSKEGIKEVVIGIAAVFDGHNGAEASEMASKLFLEYFAVHIFFLLDSAFSFASKNSGGISLDGNDKDSLKMLYWDQRLELTAQRWKFSFDEKFDDSLHLEILKEALLRTIHDVDATFTKEATVNSIDAGTTATIVLIASGRMLVANIGDSKAILCSEKFLSPSDAKAVLLKLYLEKRARNAGWRENYKSMKSALAAGFAHYVVEELTRDHHPDREDERLRIEAAGGFIVNDGGTSRINGELSVSRAIGDITFKSYGVISTPEVADWKPLIANDSYLVVASDGVFEKLSLQDVCDILATQIISTGRPEVSSSCGYSLAECITTSAYERGSMDNVAAVVVPLENVGRIPHFPLEKTSVGDGEFNFFYKVKSGFLDQPDLKGGFQVSVTLDKRLLKGDHGTLGCYYLSENIYQKVYPPRIGQKHASFNAEDLAMALLESRSNQFEGPLDLYSDMNVCMQFGMTGDKVGNQCRNPEAFSYFLGFLASVPFNQPSSDDASTEYEMHLFRYKLDKRYGRGSYGEVWLAFHRTCDEHAKDFVSDRESKSSDVYYYNSTTTSFTTTFFRPANATYGDGNQFILKRLMVERGSAFYLSGLREKYFGEVFLNASRFLSVFQSDEVTNVNHKNSNLKLCDQLEGYVSRGCYDNDMPYETLGKVIFEEGLKHIARYIEAFESKSNDMWLVFCHEGTSLSKLLYTVEEMGNDSRDGKVDEAKHFKVLRPSKYWHWLKTTEIGNEEMRYLMWQLLHGLKSCHDRNITHRDIKPENMVICFEDQKTGRCLSGGPNAANNYTVNMRLIDFGSAIDDYTIKNLYGSIGPSSAEQTVEYSPPEALLNMSWYLGSRRRNLKYDMWSVGVVMLELVLGSPHVFQVSSVTRGLLDPYVNGWNEELKELAYKLRSFMELCILVPGSSSKQYPNSSLGGGSPASWRCSEEFFSSLIKSRDPLKIGFPSIQALRLVRQLLMWDPDKRLSVDDALSHPYFQPPPAG